MSKFVISFVEGSGRYRRDRPDENHKQFKLSSSWYRLVRAFHNFLAKLSNQKISLFFRCFFRATCNLAFDPVDM